MLVRALHYVDFGRWPRAPLSEVPVVAEDCLTCRCQPLTIAHYVYIVTDCHRAALMARASSVRSAVSQKVAYRSFRTRPLGAASASYPNLSKGILHEPQSLKSKAAVTSLRVPPMQAPPGGRAQAGSSGLEGRSTSPSRPAAGCPPKLPFPQKGGRASA